MKIVISGPKEDTYEFEDYGGKKFDDFLPDEKSFDWIKDLMEKFAKIQETFIFLNDASLKNYSD